MRPPARETKRARAAPYEVPETGLAPRTAPRLRREASIRFAVSAPAADVWQTLGEPGKSYDLQLLNDSEMVSLFNILLTVPL